MQSRHRIAALIGATAIVLAACSGSATPAPSTATAPSSAPAASTATEPSAAAAGQPAEMRPRSSQFLLMSLI